MKEAKSNKKPILLASFILSIILNIAISFPNDYWIIKLAIVLLVLYIYMQFIYQYKGIFKVPSYNLSIIKVLLFNMVLILVSVLLIYTFDLIIENKSLVPFLVFVLFAVVNFLMHAFSFYTLEVNFESIKSFSKSIGALWTHKNKLFYMLLNYFKIAIQFTLLAIVMNVLVYSQRIPSILELPEAESTTQLIELFKSPLSRFIQNTIVTIGVFYIFYISAYYVINLLKYNASRKSRYR